jgi:DNA-binding CsgD family transcriptional regulator
VSGSGLQTEPKPPSSRTPDPAADAGIMPRELEVLPLVAEGLQNEEIAGGLGVGQQTVRNHRGIFRKLGAGNRTQMTREARARGDTPLMARFCFTSPLSRLAGRTERDLLLRALVEPMFPSVRRARIDGVGLSLSHAGQTQRADLVPTVADAAIHLASGTALVATLLLPWTQHGNVSLLTGNQLAGFLLTNGHHLAAISIYALAAGGCVVMAAAASQHVLVRAVRAVVAASTTVGLLFVATLGPLPIDRWGAAPTLACGGAAAVLAAELRVLLRRPVERHALMP